MAPGIPPPQPGETFVLTDQDYRYGAGPIIVRISKVIAQVQYGNKPWWHVKAEAANGTPENHGGWHCREVYIRESTFLQTRRPTIRKPDADATQ